MFRKFVLATLLFGAVLIAVGAAAYVTNGAPAVTAISTEDVAAASRPIVVKLHAQWCVYCRVTKGVWSQIEETYRGRAHFLVLDFTNDTTTEASRAEAARLGLGAFFDEFAGVTGTIVVLDPRTKQVSAEINGSRDFSEYREAIDAALSNSDRRE
jgi:thiol-disulfide isomerase/thioredoxin